jgi:transcriptional regulator with XRE-family HTH domain
MTPSEMNRIIGMTVKRLRNKAGINQSYVAEAIGLDQSALSRVEKGKQALTASQIFGLREVPGFKSLHSKITREMKQCSN